MFSNCGEFYFLDLETISLITIHSRAAANGRRNQTLAFVLLRRDQNWNHLYLNSTERKDFSIETQISVRLNGAWCAPKFEWKTISKFPVTTLGYSTVEIARLEIACSEIFELQANPGGRRSISAAKRYKNEKRGKTKKKINKNTRNS